MTSTIRTSCGLALAMVLPAGCNTPTAVRHGAEPAPVMAIAPPAPSPVMVAGSAIALPPQDPIALRGAVKSRSVRAEPDASAQPRGLAKNKGGYGPCRGKNPAAKASATQGISVANPTNPYVGKGTRPTSSSRKAQPRTNGRAGKLANCLLHKKINR